MKASPQEIFKHIVLKKTLHELTQELNNTYPRDIIDNTDKFESLFNSPGTILENFFEQTQPYSFPLSIRRGNLNNKYHDTVIMDFQDLLIYKVMSGYVFRSFASDKPHKAYFIEHGRSPEFQQTVIQNKYIIHTDISNFFGSVSHELLLKTLRLRVSTTITEMLEKLFQRINFNQGLPVDILDNCSRKLSYIFLYEYDSALIKIVGDGNYVRLVDDQIIVVDSYADATRILTVARKLLGQLGLQMNYKKTIILDQNQASSYFHLKEQIMILEWQKQFLLSKSHLPKKVLITSFDNLLTSIKTFNSCPCSYKLKYLQQLYSIASRIGYTGLINESFNHLVHMPYLSNVIFDYFITIKKFDEMLDLFATYANSDNEVFELTEVQFFEKILMAKLSFTQMKKYRIVIRYYWQKKITANKPFAAAGTIMALYWLNEKPDYMDKSFSAEELCRLPEPLVRTYLTYLAAQNVQHFLMLKKVMHNTNHKIRSFMTFLFDILESSESMNTKKLHIYMDYAKRRDNPHAVLFLEFLSQSKNPHIIYQIRKIMKYADPPINLPAKIISARIMKHLSRKRFLIDKFKKA